MRILLLCLMAILNTVAAFGQYPFEKYPSVKFKEIKIWKV
jgi:hypothetical protein